MPVADSAVPRTRSWHCCARTIVGTEATATIANAAAYLAVLFALDGMLRLSLRLPGESRLLGRDELQVALLGWTLSQRDRLNPGYCFEAKSPGVSAPNLKRGLLFRGHQASPLGRREAELKVSGRTGSTPGRWCAAAKATLENEGIAKELAPIRVAARFRAPGEFGCADKAER